MYSSILKLQIYWIDLLTNTHRFIPKIPNTTREVGRFSY